MGWKPLQGLECTICQHERKRRCRVITAENGNAKAHLTAKFAQAPLVHPFNQPKYHAQILHAITFAKATSQKILWVVARDTPQEASNYQNKADLQKQQERWLELHDRQTAGILGLFPLIEGMPVRFTETYDRGANAFKHATGLLTGWSLSDVDVAKIDASDDPEIVLQDCPAFLLVRLTAPPPDRPDGTIEVRPATRVWKLKALQVRRRGFHVAPDFAGTAHAYCGSTLRACKGDLLHWSATPTSESMLRAYIIRSRVKAADDILLVQPYSPHLFRQKKAPGPRLLLARQQGKRRKRLSQKIGLSVCLYVCVYMRGLVVMCLGGCTGPLCAGALTSDAVAEAWRRCGAEALPKKNVQGTTPQWAMWKVPCRACSEEAGEEVRWPLRCFTADVTQAAVWARLSDGQLLQCYRCWHRLRQPDKTRLIMCGMCGDLLRRSRFSAKAQELWAAHAAVQDVICQKHEEIGSAAKGPSSCSTLPETTTPKRKATPPQLICTPSVVSIGPIAIFRSRTSN